MSTHRSSRRGWLPFVLVSLLAFVVSCGGATPQAAAPLRDLTKSSEALLQMAPNAYGAQAPVDFGADDRGSAAARAEFEAATKGAVVHEPSLDLVAAVVGRLYAETGGTPALSLTYWLYWKCGYAGPPGSSNVLVVQGGMEQAYQQHMQQILASIPRTGKTPLAYGLVRLAIPGGSFQAIAYGAHALTTPALSKSQAAGSTLPVTGTLPPGFSDPMMYIETDSGDPVEVPMTLSPDGKIAGTAPIPSKPGRYFLQVKASDPRSAPGEAAWNRSVFWAPIYVGVPEPFIADDFIRRPPKNHADRSSWPIQVLEAYNAERAKLGRQPLQFLRESSLVAQASSDKMAQTAGDPPPDPGVVQRLADAGAPPHDLMHSSGSLEFVAEYIQMRLLQPWARRRVLAADASVLALGISPQLVDARPGEFAVTEYVFSPVKIDPAKDGDRILAGIEAVETAGGRKSPERDPRLSADALKIAQLVCAGGKPAENAGQIWSQVTAKSPDLLHRMASVTAGFDIAREEITYLAEPLAGEVRYTKMGVGVCQGRIDGRANAVYALVLFMGP